MITRRQLFSRIGCGAAALLTGCRSTGTAQGSQVPPFVPLHPLIGYTRFRTSLPGSRWANSVTMRAWVVQADGTEARPLAGELTNEPHSWTQFAGWSPDGQTAIIGRGWESAENGAWEEEHKTFRMVEGHWRYDMHLLDVRTGRRFHATAVERVSHYNTGLFFIPAKPDTLGFQAMIDGNMHPFMMDRDGRNKRDVSEGEEGFTYGYSASPDGERIAYHKDYQVYVARSDGSGAKKVETGNPFNFAPQWSPDGEWLMFVSGEREYCDPYVVRPDGTDLRKLASRNGYKGWVAILDVPDFHDGSSDVPVWAHDRRGIYFTAQFGSIVELMWVSLNGETRRLTHSGEGVLHYHPTVSPDGKWLAFGSTRSGARDLYVRPADPFLEHAEAHALTEVGEGHAAMWARWQTQGY